LQHYGIDVQWSGEVAAGPTFLRYPVMPGRKVRIRSILDKADDLGVQLALQEPPLIHITGGRLVLDVQRPDRQTVPFSSVADQIAAPAPGSAGSSRVPLGVDLGGTLQFVDLASPNNPHLLVAGTSGSGKSEWMRAAIAGIILANTPETLRLVLIDPKRNAFTELRGSPYLYGPKSLVYPPEDSAMEALETLIEEMEERYRRFSRHAASDLTELHAKTGEVLPRIVCVCDEYADLIADRATKKELEGAISRLGAKARAAGIHLIVATQYPDRNTVGGALKMNLGGRVCLRTINHVQSNMIINQSGAEKLLGNGDLFYRSIGDPMRLQAPYLSADERTRVFGGRVR
jgi:DNA segregation ATPase FtsK/SpoIIIE-like protein